jgi:hypothetical protein
MEKTFYIGPCPLCRDYGRLEIDWDVSANRCIVVCEECLAEWASPQEAEQNRGGRRCEGGSGLPSLRSATLREIKAAGWDKFIADRTD